MMHREMWFSGQMRRQMGHTKMDKEYTQHLCVCVCACVRVCVDTSKVNLQACMCMDLILIAEFAQNVNM